MGLIMKKNSCSKPALILLAGYANTRTERIYGLAFRPSYRFQNTSHNQSGPNFAYSTRIQNVINYKGHKWQKKLSQNGLWADVLCNHSRKIRELLTGGWSGERESAGPMSGVDESQSVSQGSRPPSGDARQTTLFAHTAPSTSLTRVWSPCRLTARAATDFECKFLRSNNVLLFFLDCYALLDGSKEVGLEANAKTVLLISLRYL
jgi:hypothetical protein